MPISPLIAEEIAPLDLTRPPTSQQVEKCLYQCHDLAAQYLQVLNPCLYVYFKAIELSPPPPS